MESRGIPGWARLAGALALVFAAQLAGGPVAGDWPQFRGVNRDGVSAETGLLRSWPEDGPREVWRVAVGEGFSGISAVGERVYTMYAAERDGEPMELAAAFDAETGKEIWSVAIGKRYDNVFGNGPRSTPTVDGDVVYVLGSMGDLLALGAEDGAERWRLSFTEDFSAKVPNFGFSTSALIDGPRLVVETGGPEGKSLAALDRESGEVEWTFGDPPGDGGGSYNSPILVRASKTTRYVYIVGDRMTCLDDSGKEVWSHPWTYPGETHAMPVFVPPNRIFASGAEGVGATLVAVKEKGGKVLYAPTAKMLSSTFLRDIFFFDKFIISTCLFFQKFACFKTHRCPKHSNRNGQK